MSLKFNEIIVPSDGNCLFYSMGYALDKNHNDLRIQVSEFIEKNKFLKFNELTLEEWIKYDVGLTVNNYKNMILTNGQWGGNIELYILMKIYKINIFILKRDNGRYTMINSYVYDNNSRNIFLKYDGFHYNYLKVIENETKIKT